MLCVVVCVVLCVVLCVELYVVCCVCGAVCCVITLRCFLNERREGFYFDTPVFSTGCRTRAGFICPASDVTRFHRVVVVEL